MRIIIRKEKLVDKSNKNAYLIVNASGHSSYPGIICRILEYLQNFKYSSVSKIFNKENDFAFLNQCKILKKNHHSIKLYLPTYCKDLDKTTEVKQIKIYKKIFKIIFRNCNSTMKLTSEFNYEKVLKKYFENYKIRVNCSLMPIYRTVWYAFEKSILQKSDDKNIKELLNRKEWLTGKDIKEQRISKVKALLSSKKIKRQRQNVDKIIELLSDKCIKNQTIEEVKESLSSKNVADERIEKIIELLNYNNIQEERFERTRKWMSSKETEVQRLRIKKLKIKSYYCDAIKVIDVSIPEIFPNLEKLILNSCFLRNLRDFTVFTKINSLKCLEINDAGIQSLEKFGEKTDIFYNIKYLNFEQNDIRSLKGINKFPNLEIFIFNLCNIRSFSGIGSLKKLKVLGNISVLNIRDLNKVKKIEELKLLENFKFLCVISNDDNNPNILKQVKVLKEIKFKMFDYKKKFFEKIINI